MPRLDTYDASTLHKFWEELDHLAWIADLVSAQTGQKIVVLPDHEDPELYTVHLPTLEWTLCTFRSAKNLMYGYQQGFQDARNQA